MIYPKGVTQMKLYGSPNPGVGSNARLVLYLAPDGSPVLGLRDKEGRGRAALFLNADGSPGLVFADSSGKVTWKAP